MRLKSVERTLEFRRICELPRRTFTREDAVARARELTPEFRRRNSSAQLRPWQGYVLHEADLYGGALAGLPVGQGKTLLTMLLPLMFGAKRPVLMGPTNMRDKTMSDFRMLKKDWHSSPHPYEFVAFRDLTQDENWDLLDRIAPDLVVVDESDDLANPESSMSVRLTRYLKKSRAPCVTASGTFIRDSILALWAALWWCLGENAPIPRKAEEVRRWAGVLDGRPRRKVLPGALGATVEDAIEWFATRLTETPGVIFVDEDSCEAPLIIRQRRAPDDVRLSPLFRELRLHGKHPGGQTVSDRLSELRLDSELSLGLYRYWDPEPPKEWRVALQKKNQLVRLRRYQTRAAANPLDTEKQVLCRHADHPVVVRWREVKDTFRERTKVRWVSRSVLDDVHDWLEASDEPSIVWVGNIPFGRALAREIPAPFFRQKGLSDDGVPLYACPTRTIVVSWKSNKKGWNLQAWGRHAVIDPPQSSKWWEQLLGRPHRAGRTDTVEFTVFVTSGGVESTLQKAIKEAGRVRGLSRMTQKLLRADVRPLPKRRVTERDSYRWGTSDTFRDKE